jgi:uncharacterized membrane protein
MTAEPRAPHRIEHWVHRSLLAGLVLSGLLLSAGLMATWIGDQPQDGDSPQPLAAIVENALRGRGEALMTLGVLALMATPIVRVGVLAAGWMIEGDWRFAAIAGAVLTLLGVSLYLGMG